MQSSVCTLQSARRRRARWAAVAVSALIAVVAAAQTSAPPAEYRPDAPRKAGLASGPLLPRGLAGRSIALPPPTAAELAQAKARRQAGPARAGERTKSRRLQVGFARGIPAGEASVLLSDLPWQLAGGGMRATQVTVRSPGAAALRFALVLTDAPAGLVARFQGSADGAVTHGPYSAAEIAGEDPYWSPVVDGDTATIELALPPGVSPGEAKLVMPLVSHFAAAPLHLKMSSDPNIGAAGACEVDIACYDVLQQQQLRTATNAVARIVLTIKGVSYLCTGTVVNDAVTSYTPYLLMANHCLEDDDFPRSATARGTAAASASTINTYWQFQAAACGSLATPNYTLLAGGAKLLARSADSDWALVRLNSSPPEGTTFAAWNAAGPLATGTAGAAIHHPEGDLKKLSLGNVLRYSEFDDGSSFIEMGWTRGVTELGSSGSGLFTANAAGEYFEVRGTLWAGDSDCSYPQGTDYYTRLDVAYPLLSQYLAPMASNPAKTTPVVEYYGAAQDAYFITADPAEIADRDNGRPAGWVRTGYRFLAYTDPTAAPAGTQPVCRLYAPPPWGDTHFYSASAQECANMLAQPSLHFTSESVAAFYLQLPTAAGVCPADTRAIYRFLDKSGLPRRRYTAEVTLRDALDSSTGWTQEGEGSAPGQVAMCAPVGGALLPGPVELNYQGLWWNASESGWGINFAHQGDIIFATWFTYDPQNQPRWLIAELHKSAAGVYAGVISAMNGPPFNAVPFPAYGSPGGATESPVGIMTATFSDGRHSTLQYIVNGVAQTKAIVPQEFGPLPTCTWGAQPNLALATNYTDLWWNSQESGWGINFTHQGDIIFATWFTYDAQSRPWWLIAELHKGATGVYTGVVSTMTGPPFNAVPFPPYGSPGGATEFPIGTITATFSGGAAATLAYEVNGLSQSKAITRQVFAPPGTVCQ